MFNYSIDSWLLIFFAYCFLGWVWETCYVSFKDRKFANRGFLYGPFLPIYGFGAITIIFCTLGVRDSLIGIYFLGTISVTILELITGIIMEKLFTVRYWDYSYKKYHYKGYICLSSTIAWGFFAILLVNYVNQPIETFILGINDQTKGYLSTFILIYFTADTTMSARNAFDLKKLLTLAYENVEIVRDLADQLEEVHDNIAESTNEVKEQIVLVRERVRLYRKENILKAIETQSYIQSKIDGIATKISEDLKQSTKLSNIELEELKALQIHFNDLKASISRKENRLKEIDLSNFKGAMGVLRRNPRASSDKLKEVLEQLKKLK